jgi:hypothetical protein
MDAGATGSIADRLAFPLILRGLCRRRVGVEPIALGEREVEAHRIMTLDVVLMIRV